MLMKTVFKKGMKVYDQVNFPDMEGRVDEIDLVAKYPITVSFGIQEYEGFYSLDGTERNSFKPTLSTKPYEVELKGFEQKAPAPTFEEAWNNSHNSKEIFYSSNCDKVCSGYPTQELADASEALRRLLFLRDYYNEGWKPDWKDGSYKEILCFEADFHSKKDFKYRFYSSKSEPRVLAFKDSEVRKRFFEDQKELLEIAKPLL